MAKRYCGNVNISVRYNDKRCDYACSLTTPKAVKRVRVGEPALRTVAVDSQEAYDSVAHAALSFAVDEDPSFADEAAFGLADGNYVITRKKEKSK